jgi:hypothetical protein
MLLPFRTSDLRTGGGFGLHLASFFPVPAAGIDPAARITMAATSARAATLDTTVPAFLAGRWVETQLRFYSSLCGRD